MSDDARQPGISLRFIREYDVEADKLPTLGLRIPDQALVLAMADERELTFDEKLKDALTFLRQRIN